MDSYSHLSALENRRHNEEMRLAAAKAAKPSRLWTVAKIASEIAFREREVASVNREIAAERKFLGMEPEGPVLPLSDDDLLSDLLA